MCAPASTNLLVDKAGEVFALIDWEHCLSGPPSWDLSLALHDLSTDQKQALLAGYGVSDEESRALAPGWRALNFINYAPFIERALEEGKEDELNRFRIRLSGALDLYSL